MRRVKRGTLKRYDIPKQRSVDVPSYAPAEWVNVEGMSRNPKTKWWDGAPEDAIPYVVMDHIEPGFQWCLAPVTAKGRVCDCKDFKQRGATPFTHAADCDNDPTDHAALLEVIERFKKGRRVLYRNASC